MFCFNTINIKVLRENTDMTKVLVEAGASLYAVDDDVIKSSVKLRQ
jgi:hypothetical protein